VAKGFNQVEGTDYAQTFAPTATLTSMRVLLTVAARHNWLIYHFNFMAAYLNAPIDKEVWVRVPEGLPVQMEKLAYWTNRSMVQSRQPDAGGSICTLPCVVGIPVKLL
jgi:hypothetical protein